ncbi:PQQ enzyme repeat protein [Gemmata obscuriglobus]|nr:hypothetical protein [Gemmata obscuriglobus]QEG27662.1 PQQ enzyme repeat protein [Gemmata obscuriglobus]VTS04847.1 na-ca exchanger integrin-beta4 : Hemolysin-type calcium-binding region domain protein OS=Rhodopirellula maiorica SM1 GN=RMSM_03614 PE=4 SV=1 [Gemmata obscuriglobus UQM 2246]
MSALRAPNLRARLRAEALEDRLTPSSTVTSAEPPTEVRIEGEDAFAFYPRASVPSFAQVFAGYDGGGAVAASADVSGDGVWDYVFMAGINGHVKVFDGRTGAELRSFIAYPGYTGSVSLSVTATNGNGPSDIVTAAGTNGHVRVFDGRTGEAVRSFFAYSGYVGSVNVLSVDVSRDGVADIVTGADVNGHVKVFDGRTGKEVTSYFAYAGFTGSIGLGYEPALDGGNDISTFAIGSTHRKLFDGMTGAELRSFLDADMDNRPDDHV